MKEIALLGPTASGKSALAVEIARKFGANILSLDSLSIYRETDIVSAKPTPEERCGIMHFGIDVLQIDDYFSAATFFDLYKEAREASVREGKDLIIVGGTSFYLKSLMEGLSPKITPCEETLKRVQNALRTPEKAYELIKLHDRTYAAGISAHDRYRIGKWLEIFYETGDTATTFFQKHKRSPLIREIPVFEIATERNALRKRIALRTTQMIGRGLIEEVFSLERKYGRKPNPMKAIGIKETLMYLDGLLGKETLHAAITTHTAQLAKRQETFNTSQFPQRIKLLKDDLIKYISKSFY